MAIKAVVHKNFATRDSIDSRHHKNERKELKQLFLNLHTKTPLQNQLNLGRKEGSNQIHKINSISIYNLYP